MHKPDVTMSREEDFINSSYGSKKNGFVGMGAVKYYNVPLPQDVHAMAMVAKAIKGITLRDYIIDAIRKSNTETLKQFPGVAEREW